MLTNSVYISIITCLAVYLFYITNKQCENRKDTLLLLLIFVSHFSMSIFHWFRIINKAVDIHYFYEIALNSNSWFGLFGIGSRFMAFLIYPLVKIQASYLTLFLLFSLISLLAYTYLFKLFLNTIKTKIDNVFFLLLLLYPSIHFWTVSFGKEAILMPLLFYIVYKVKERSFSSITLYLCMLMILLIRPYLFVILLMSFVLAVFLDKTFNSVFKKKTLMASVAIFSFSIPVLMWFLKIKSWNDIANNYARVAVYAANNGSSSINLLESNYFERLFLTLFRPFFYDVISVFHFFASIENLMFLVFLIFLIVKIKNIGLFSQSLDVKFAFFTALLLILFYSIYMYNLGLANRMKVMFLPYLGYVYFSLTKKRKQY